MTIQKYHLAQLNIADAKGDYSSDIMQGFVSRLDEINGLAESSSGFIWRYQDDEGADVPERVFGKASIIVNLSVWESIDSLKQFVYKSIHKELIKGKGEWMNKMPEMHQVLWWIPAGHTPSTQEANDKLNLIREIGPSAEAFSFAKPFNHEQVSS